MFTGHAWLVWMLVTWHAGASSTRNETCPLRRSTTFATISPLHTSCPALPDLTGPGEWPPWSSPSLCTAGRKPDTFCIFTASHLGHLGLSVITSPQVASSLAPAIHRLHDSAFPAGSTVRNPALHPPPGKLAQIDGKGIGVVATRRLSAGDTFLVDFASLVLHADYPRATTEKERLNLLEDAVDKLLGPGPQAIRALSKSGLSNHALEDVVQTNVFTRQVEGHDHHILYPIISRINHSCQPNSFLRYSTHGLTVGVAAFRDIEVGEEITISYISPVDTREDRRRRLSSHWGFNCSCHLCVKGGSRDDTARTKIRYLRAAAFKAISVRELDRAKAYLNELVRAIEAEDMPPLLAEPYEALFRVYQALGEADQAQMYASLLLDVRDQYGRLEIGDRDADLAELLQGSGSLGTPKA